MKLSPVLSKFLAANKQLSLPGIGTFHSESAYDPDYDGKKAVVLNNITFSQEKVDGFDDTLVEFVSKETGKMKVLASSDLSSQLDDVTQFINTGKPYFFIGIGTLAKKLDGTFEFFPEKYASHIEKKKEAPITEKNIIPQTYIDNSTARNRSFKPAIIIITLSLIAIAATVWFWMKNQEEAKKHIEDLTVNTEPTPPATITPVNDSNTVVLKDSAANTVSITPVSSSDTYTYVLEVAKEPRVSKRFNQLKQIGWQVELQTIDSLSKRIIMKLPRAGADTLRIKDSLRVLSGKQITIIP